MDGDIKYTKCPLCYKPFILSDNHAYSVDLNNKLYYFDTNDCMTMFQRLRSVYSTNFSVSEKEYISDPLNNIITDNVPNKDNNIDSNICIIKNPIETLEISKKIAKDAKNEILIIFSTFNSFYRTAIGEKGYDILESLKTSNNNIKIRILTPYNNKIENIARSLKTDLDIEIRYLAETIQMKLSVIVVDRVHSLAVEIDNDNAGNSSSAIGISTYSNSKQTVLYYVVIFESLWQQANLYREIEELYTQLKLKDENISVVAHDMRSPLSPIINSAELIRDRDNIDESAKKDLLNVIITSAKKLTNLTDNLLEMSKIDRQLLNLNIENVDLVEILKNSIVEAQNILLYKTKDIKIIPRFAKSSVMMNIDLLKINQVIYNLISNSIKFTPNGKIEIILDSYIDDKYILIQIKDTGIGITDEIKSSIFNKFVTRSESGIGLGLYICKSIIDAHSGKIWANNNKDGKGATFNVILPIDRR
ncbi:MAG: sensor histidine kinase [Nitrososphaeraceae archaeon]